MIPLPLFAHKAMVIAVLMLLELSFAPRALAAEDVAKANVTALPPIQDNSLLIEEAYNQEEGVVQHINTLTRSLGSHAWIYTFTQEWPVHGLRHQLSYTASAVNTGNSTGAGLGDVAINYRYQLFGSGDARFALAPRVSLLAPAGSPRAGRGFGGYGVQINVPASVTIGRQFVTHWNAGTTLVPRAQDAMGNRAFSTGYNAGQSLVWLARPRFNVLVETTWTGMDRVVGPNRTERVHDLVISPGIRWAYNLPHGLQIVPAIGIPVGVGPSSGERGIVLYLSLEHPFVAERKK